MVLSQNSQLVEIQRLTKSYLLCLARLAIPALPYGCRILPTGGNYLCLRFCWPHRRGLGALHLLAARRPASVAENWRVQE